MKDLPLSKAYQLLEPGPVVLLTTARKGQANIMIMSWHMMVEFETPLVACVVSNANHSLPHYERRRNAQLPFQRWNWHPRSWVLATARGGMWTSSRDSA